MNQQCAAMGRYFSRRGIDGKGIRNETITLEHENRGEWGIDNTEYGRSVERFNKGHSNSYNKCQIRVVRGKDIIVGHIKCV